MICDVCKGPGNLIVDINYSKNNPHEDVIRYKICNKCDGYGIIDNWIENIFGKKLERFPIQNYDRIFSNRRMNFTKHKIPIEILKNTEI